MQTFKPSHHLTFETIIENKRRLHAFLNEVQDRTWCFDLCQVEACDSAGIALLIDAKRLSQRGSRICQFEGASSAIHALIEFCGVEHVLR